MVYRGPNKQTALQMFKILHANNRQFTRIMAIIPKNPQSDQNLFIKLRIGKKD